MITRDYYTALDNNYEEYCTTKCPIHKNIYIGSLDCHKCKSFISEEHKEGFHYMIKCRKEK